jgi:tetratricopeptide (TPR) repeat protein
MTDAFDDFEQAAAELEARLAEGDLNEDVVHAAVGVFGHLGRDEAVVDLITRYLEAGELRREEEAWARWELVDRLARAGRCDEAVESHREFLDWARRTLPGDRLLWVLAGGRPAHCWVVAGRHDEWLATLRDLLRRTRPTGANRMDRLSALRTAGIVLTDLGRYDEALVTARAMRRVADEDPAWENSFWAWTAARILQLTVYQVTGQRETLRRVARAVATLLDQQRELLERGEPARTDVVTLRGLYHETAVPLYQAGEYEQALPLLERAVELGATEPEVRERLSRARAILDR